MCCLSQQLLVQMSVCPTLAPLATIAQSTMCSSILPADWLAGIPEFAICVVLSGSNGEVTFTATIPASEFNAGDMVRWKVLVRR